MKKIYIADFETITYQTKYYKKTGDTRVILCCVMDYESDKHWLFYDIESFFKNFVNKLEQSSIIYFHNLSFDGDFITKYLFNNSSKKLTRKLNYRESGWDFFRSGTHIYSIRYGHWVSKKKYIKVDFRCSLKLLSASVNALGSTFGLNKYSKEQEQNLEEFYKMEPLDPKNLNSKELEFINYCINDCLIVKTALTYFFKEIESLNLPYSKNDKYLIRGDLKLTIGSLAIAIMKSLNNFRWKNIKTTQKEYDVGSLFFRGGLTQFNPKYQNKLVDVKNGCGIDINSSYPYQMTKLLPLSKTLELLNLTSYEQVLFLYNANKNNPITKLYFVEVFIENVEQKYKECYFLPKFDNNSKQRYLGNCKNYHGYFMLNELEELKNFYEFKNIKLMNCWTVKTQAWLTKYINLLYSFKEKFSRSKDSPRALTYKILLNSSYGKFATREVFDFEYHCTYEIDIGEQLEINDKLYSVKRRSKVRELGDGDVCLILKPEERNKNMYNKITAAAITAYARIQLMHSIFILDPTKFIYCDTDSIYCENPDLTKLEIDKYKLGAWDCELTFDQMLVKGAKAYICSEKSIIKSAKYSGINNGYLKRNLDYSLFQNEELLENANVSTVRTKSGILLIPKNYEPKERKL